ncbi:actin-related protein 10 isoform X2 [Agrilus planipennis]|uniref:Actin-related protein 10 isoform X1 n=1 Tax=Agrilus planipennis TaxID=224129 RepID=A0A7F5RGI7_AGRPL|nr:actin-related protein 10 isoform X1 [Agrilus planipennis]XP_025835084.1 actin-related protein 10 isoform X2 [Agrilus planipennis]XP_025835085.1 actin-related protein 10 isoform X1 [Agrilus planipennis]XP_025835086.1 actin-related protein 10 isoform X2 [Agrilus planipennis]
MPLYEGIGTEKLTVVMDLGAAFTKLGFSGEFAPRHIIRSEVTLKGSNLTREIYSYVNGDDLYDLLVEFLHMIFFKYVLLSPKDKPVIIVESLLCPTIFRETLAKVLFSHYEIYSLLIVPSHLVSLAPLAINTALVVDVGYLETTVIPICHGLPVLHAWQALPLASQAINNKLRKHLHSCNIKISEVKQNIIDDIKVRCCFVTPQRRAIQFLKSNSQLNYCPDLQYPLGGTKIINVPGKIRETVAEFLFEEDNDHQCLSTMVLDSILKVNVDLRVKLAENILLTGGTVMLTGFKARFKEELYKQLNSSRYEKLKLSKFMFHSAPSKDNYTAWLGGAIYGATEVLGMKSITREYYFKESRLPDWPNMKDNSRIQ